MHYSHLLVQEMFLKYWQASFQPKYVTINKKFSCSYCINNYFNFVPCEPECHEASS